jgi:SAM-dependent methyltransferase
LLAACGHAVTGLDLDEELLGTMRDRAAGHGLEIETVRGDASDFHLGKLFDAVLAPMQLVQLLRLSAQRRALLRCARRHLRPGGVFACALLDLRGEPIDTEFAAPLPDMREEDAWVYASHPVAIRSLDRGRAISLDRLRRTVSPAGDVAESLSQIRLELISPQSLESEARAEGLLPAGLRTIPATEDYVGSIIVVAHRAAEEAASEAAPGARRAAI